MPWRSRTSLPMIQRLLSPQVSRTIQTTNKDHQGLIKKKTYTHTYIRTRTTMSTEESLLQLSPLSFTNTYTHKHDISIPLLPVPLLPIHRQEHKHTHTHTQHTYSSVESFWQKFFNANNIPNINFCCSA